MHIGSPITDNVPEANPEYAEVAEEYEEDVLVISFLKPLLPFRSLVPAQETRCIIPTFQDLLCLFAH